MQVQAFFKEIDTLNSACPTYEDPSSDKVAVQENLQGFDDKKMNKKVKDQDRQSVFNLKYRNESEGGGRARNVITTLHETGQRHV